MVFRIFVRGTYVEHTSDSMAIKVAGKLFSLRYEASEVSLTKTTNYVFGLIYNYNLKEMVVDRVYIEGVDGTLKVATGSYALDHRGLILLSGTASSKDKNIIVVELPGGSYITLNNPSCFGVVLGNLYTFVCYDITGLTIVDIYKGQHSYNFKVKEF